MFSWCGVLVIFIAFVERVDGACTFPTTLQNNNWTSSGFGNMEFTASAVTFTDDTSTLSTYSCLITAGSDYVIQSPVTTEFSTFVHYYYCFELTELSTYSFSYYLKSSLDNISNRRKTFVNTTVVTTTGEVCDISPITAELYVLVQRDAPHLAASSCTTPLLGNFQYTAVVSVGGAVCGTSPGDGVLGVCDGGSTNVIYNYTTCSTVLSYSTNGALYCIASSSTTVGSTMTYYQVLYNTDSSPTYQFDCMALSYDAADNSIVYASEIHTVCQENQNATVAVTGGNLITFTANDTCVPVVITTTPSPSEDSLNIGLIVGLVIAGLLLLLIIAAVLFYCLYWKKRDPNAGKPIVENTKPRFEEPIDIVDLEVAKRALNDFEMEDKTENPDKEDILEDLELEDTRSEPLTRDDIVFTAESPSFLPNGNAHVLTNGHAVGPTPTSTMAKDSKVGLTDFSRPRDKQITPRLNRDLESMVIFNGDEKVISGNDSRVVPSEHQTFRRFQPGTSDAGPGGPLTLQGLEDDDGDGLGELSPSILKDMPYPSVPREKSNLLPPIETIDQQKDN